MREVEDELDRLVALVHAIIYFDINGQLNQIANNLFASLSECFLHMRTGSRFQHRPDRVLHAATGYPHRMIDAESPPLLVGGILFSKSAGHLICEDIGGINIGQAD